MLLDGRSMALDCGAEGRLELLEPFAPRSRDFNVMVDRAAATLSLEVLVLDAPLVLAAEGIAIVHVLEGSLEGADAGDTLVDEAPLRLAPRGLARVAIARVVPLTGPASSPSRTPLPRR